MFLLQNEVLLRKEFDSINLKIVDEPSIDLNKHKVIQ